MSDKYGRERLLIIDGELAEEEQKQEIQYQLYHDCYMYALRSILKDTLWKIEEPQETAEPLYPREVNNIISFIGDRGTGKTTVLREFCWLLQNFRSGRKSSWINSMPLDEEAKERLLRIEINFTVLSPIDASLLEEKEDLFELILAGLFEKCEELWRGGSYTYENRYSKTREMLLKKFGEVYRNHKSVKQGDRQEDPGESVVTRLRTMASSKKIQTAFGELIDSFFHLIEGGNTNRAVDYLIIVIDDLDLNLEHGFQMLEELQKYLTHSNVIILTALSYKQLSLITESHFVKNIGYSAGGKNPEELALHGRELAKDYLDKLIPVNNRIYMPDIYTKSQDIEIRNDNEKKSIQAKKYIMLKNAGKMHIYYDGLGIKKHFVEKRTVRTLLSSVEFLNSLATVDFSEARMIKGKVLSGVSEKNFENVKKLQKKLVRAYGRNYERYNADIQERMIFEKTDEQQRRFFDDLMGIQLTRRGRYVAALKAENFKSLALNGNALSISYYYGDLLECIYTWGRRREQDKPLIHCIMASFTSEMVHEYICYMYSPDETKRSKSRRKLEHFLGEGFGNDWTGKMLPVRISEEIFSLAFFRTVEFQMINCYFPLERLYTFLMQLETAAYSMSEKTWQEKFIKEVGEAVAKDFEENKAIWSLQCMDMLFENACLNQQQMPALSFSFNIFERTFISLSKNTPQPRRKGLVLRVGIDTQQADFDILGFVKKSIAPQEEQREKYKKIFEDISAAIYKYVAEYVRLENAVGIEEKLTRKLTAQLKKQSIFEKFKTADAIAFPFYDFDLSYNIIKRVRDKCSRSFTQPTLLQDIVKNIVKIYGFIEEELTILDIADGLRAIEECVRFLNMQCGDRIGHGTVLGIDVHSWYKVKHNTIIIPVQDYLDNVAWMYNKIIEFQIEGCDILRDYLNKEFDFYFSELYEKNIRSQHLTGNNFNIYNYYNAWKLRGDEPSLYIDGRFSKERYQNAGRYVVDHLHRENRVLRHNEECSLLYYYYHYSWDIRSQGTKRKEIHIPQFYIDGIEKLQKAMQNFVSERGIGIETNPTSNYLISVMNSYEEHPILRFYNKGLDADYEEKNTCPQLFVSVNTDDKGIFRTSLENEFSYLAASLESEEKPNGEKKYNRQMVYQWIDDIREMGIEQSFLGNVEEN